MTQNISLGSNLNHTEKKSCIRATPLIFTSKRKQFLPIIVRLMARLGTFSKAVFRLTTLSATLRVSFD